jgi:hypothetical protein
MMRYRAHHYPSDGDIWTVTQGSADVWPTARFYGNDAERNARIFIDAREEEDAYERKADERTRPEAEAMRKEDV